MIGRYPRRFGKYVLLKPLAKGGMGEIYLAAGGEVGGFEKLCVIKKVITEKADNTKANRFLDEAKVVLRLSHAALVNTFDAGEVEGEFYIAMELVEGKDLREVWNRCVRMRQRIPLDVALHVVREVARALAYVHSYGDLKLVHRDVAPPNILLAYVGDVKLTDFGLARSVLKQEHTAPGVVFGRAAYLAPEQARGEVADARTDIYTLGIVLWELLTGQQFLQLGGLDPAAALAIVRHPKLLPPSSKAPWITPALDQVVMLALAPDRAQRYQSAEEFRQGLSEVMAEIAPRADAARVSEFLHMIYADTIADERGDRERYLKDEIPLFRANSSQGGAPTGTTPPGGSPVLDPPGGPPAAEPAAGALDAAPPNAEPASTGPETPPRLSPPPRPRTPAAGAPLDVRGARPEPAPAAQPRPGRARPSGGVVVHLPGIAADGAAAEAVPARPRDVASLAELARAAEQAGVVVRGRRAPEPSRPALPGTSSRTVAPEAKIGAYKILRSLAESGGISLYEAEDEARPGRVALRVFGVPRTPAPNARAAWEADGWKANELGSPHIVKTLEAGVTDAGQPWRAVAALAGIDLPAKFARTHRLDQSAALRIVAQICQALAAAHAAGLVHGALWPGCVFLASRDRAGTQGETTSEVHGDSSDVAQLMDFGVVWLHLDGPPGPTGMGRGLGAIPAGLVECLAPELLAPHAAEGGASIRRPDVRADIYGLGAVFYEMLTGAPPFTATREGLDRKRQGPPQPPRLFRPEVSEGLDRLVLAMLDPDPARRFQSIADVQTALGRLPPPREGRELEEGARDGSSSQEGRPNAERRRARREAAFRAISELAAEPPPPLPAAIDPASRSTAQRPVAAERTSPVTPPAQSEAAAPARPLPPRGPFFSPPTRPALEALAPAPTETPLTAPSPVLGGGMLARYGVGAASEERVQRARRMRRIVVALVALVALAAGGAVALRYAGRGTPPAAVAPGR